MSALQMSRDLDCQYKTAWVLMHKLRESMHDDEPVELDGEVEVDAAYFNGHVRPANRIENRVDRRLKKNQDPDKRAVYVARERHNVDGEGSFKTAVGVAKSENEASIKAFVARHVDSDATITADEHHSYGVLHGHYKMERVNHSVEYVGVNGESTNQAESFFSRLRRMHLGQNHKFSNVYLNRYATECAYREDHRRESNGWVFNDLIERCARKRPSRDFAGYWQGNRKGTEDLLPC